MTYEFVGSKQNKFPPNLKKQNKFPPTKLPISINSPRIINKFPPNLVIIFTRKMIHNILINNKLKFYFSNFSIFLNSLLKQSYKTV